MLRLQRPPEPPRLLRQRSILLAKALLGDLNAGDAAEGGYNLAEVREALAEAQQNIEGVVRCAYCGREIARRYFPIDHFRPRHGYERGDRQHHQGYWWLTWTWENLWLVCPTCNGKGSQFCLEHDTLRLSPPNLDDIELAFELVNERSLLLDPAVDDPRAHLEVAEDAIEGWHWRPLTERGRYTIEVLELATNDWSHSRRSLDTKLIQLSELLAQDSTRVHEQWNEVTDDFLDSITPYRDRIWWYLNHWYDRLDPRYQTILGGMPPFPNAHLPQQLPQPNIAEWWPIPSGREPSEYLREWLNSVSRDVQILERRERLVVLCAQPRTVKSLEDETGEMTVRADLASLLLDARVKREKRGRAHVYQAIRVS